MAKTTEAVKHLVCAAGMGDLNMVRAVLKKNPEAAHDWRPIMEACYKGFAPIVELLAKHVLLKHGANPAARDCNGNKPIDIARQKRRVAVVELLATQ